MFDSAVIREYLDGRYGTGNLFPQDPGERWLALRRHALADGTLDTLILWRAELAKPEARRTPEWLATFDLKIRRRIGISNDIFRTLALYPPCSERSTARSLAKNSPSR